MKLLGYTFSDGSVLCARHTRDESDPNNETGCAGAIFSTDEAHENVVCDVAGCGIILARNCCDGCGTAGCYKHFLFYDDPIQAQDAFECIKGAFDASADLYPLKGHDYACAVHFTTTSEFSEKEAEALIQATEPDEYDLNNTEEDEE
jgi:hypothetical protein